MLAFEVNSATPNYEKTQTYCYFKIRIPYQLIDLKCGGVMVKKVQGVSCDRLGVVVGLGDALGLGQFFSEVMGDNRID